MTSEELNSKSAFPSAPETLDEEDEFLRELRQLAGMDEPAAPAQQSGKTEAAPQYSQAYQPPVQQYQPPVQQYQPPVQQYQAPVQRQEQPVEQPAWEPDYPTPADSLYEERDSVLPGWLKGILLLTASAATLVLTVLAVLNGLQH